MKLTAKQKRFVQEYLIDLNATQAAIRAGYSKKSAHSIGPENLEKPEIKQAIEEKLKQIDDEKTADAKEVIEYLTSVMRGESKSEVLSLCGSGRQEVIEKKPEERDRLKAAELIGKRYGLFTDRFQIESEKEELSKLDQLLSDITNVAKDDGS